MDYISKPEELDEILKYCEEQIHDTVYVSSSNIKNAGEGLFSKTSLPPEYIIQEYRGEVFDKYEKSNPYAYETKDKKIIIPDDKCLVSKINDIIDVENGNKKRIGYNYNVEFVELHNRVFVVTLDFVEKDEEFFIDYGDIYWKK